MEQKFDKECIKKRAEYFAKLLIIQPFLMQTKNGEKYSRWIDITSEDPDDIQKLRDIITFPEVHRTRLECELIIDFDNKELRRNMERAVQTQSYLLEEWGIKTARWFSGNKGVHLHAFIPGITRKQILGLFFRTSQRFRTKMDKGLMQSSRHMIRGEYSLNSKSGNIKVPLDKTEPEITHLDQNILDELDFIADANRVVRKKDYRQWYSSGGKNE